MNGVIINVYDGDVVKYDVITSHMPPVNDVIIDITFHENNTS